MELNERDPNPSNVQPTSNNSVLKAAPQIITELFRCLIWQGVETLSIVNTLSCIPSLRLALGRQGVEKSRLPMPFI